MTQESAITSNPTWGKDYFNGQNQEFIYSNDASLRVNTINNAETVIQVSKEIDLEINTDKTMFEHDKTKSAEDTCTK
jgi:hypothetical protein